MISPCERRRQHVLAAKHSQAGAPEVRANDEYALQLMQLHQDMQTLHGIQSNELKATVKINLLPKYEPWVTATIQNGTGTQDDVLMRILVWRIDTGDFSGALDIAEYAIDHDLHTPDDFARTTGCLVAEEMATRALNAISEGQIVDPRVLLRAGEITEVADMPDKVRAKLFKATGYALRAAGDNDRAKAAFTRALKLYDKVGVKTDLKALDKEMQQSDGTGDEKASENPESDSNSSSTAEDDAEQE